MNFELITGLISIVLILITGIWYYITINSAESKDDVVVKHESCVTKNKNGIYERHPACERPCSSNNNDNIIEVKVPKTDDTKTDDTKTKCHQINRNLTTSNSSVSRQRSR